MSDHPFDPIAHWDDRHRTTAPTELSWFQEHSTTSLDLIHTVLEGRPASIIDIGGGTGRLVDDLLDEGHHVTVVDISQAALDLARSRLPASSNAAWIQADLRTWAPRQRWDLWHDRAMLHFLTDPPERQRYAATMRQAVGIGGGFVIGVFAEDGPTQCSGLAVHRSTAADLLSIVGDAEIVAERRSTHITPSGAEQRFRWIAGRLL